MIQDNVRDYLNKLRSGELKMQFDNQTHFMEILMMIRSGGLGEFVTTIETHYTHSSLVYTFKFADGKSYRIEIREEK